jgi:hypothetical protein
MSFPTFQPEELDELAERLATSGATDVSTTLRLCAENWRATQRDLHIAQSDNTKLQQRISTAERALRASS